MSEGYKIGSMGVNEWNAMMQKRAHEGHVACCPLCAMPNQDFKTVLMRDKEIWLGACRRCSDKQTKEVHDYMNCKDLLEPIAK